MNRRSKPRTLSCEPLPLSHNCRTYLRMLQDEMDSQFTCMVQCVASRGPQPKVEPSVPPSTSAVLGACCLYGLRNSPDSPHLSLSSGSAYSESGGTTDTRSQSPEYPLDDSTADMQAITLLQECQALFLEEWQSRNRQTASSSCSQWLNSSSSSALLPAGNHAPSVVQPLTEHYELTDAAGRTPAGPDLVMPTSKQDPSASGSAEPALSGFDSHLSANSCRDSLKSYAVPESSPVLRATVEERISTPLYGAAPLSEDPQAACERYSVSQSPLRHRSLSKAAADSAAADSAAADSAAATEAVDKEPATQAAATGTLTDPGPQHTGDSASNTATLASAAPATQDAPQPKSAGCWTCRLRRKACDRRHPTCKACQDLGISCHGYAETPPSFMRDPAQRRQQLELIKLTTLQRRSHRLSAKNAAQSAAVQQYPPKGCWTCLLRRKRCDKRKPICGVCEALGIACDGFAPPRPSFLTDPVARELRKAETRRYNKAQASRQHAA